MKLTVKQENLSKALAAVGRIATGKAGLPILSNVLLRTDNNRLIVASTNLEVAIVQSISASIKAEGAIAVPARLLTDFVNNLPHTNIEIETDETKLKISADSYKSTINSFLADDYPALPEPEEKDSFQIPSDLLKSSVAGTSLVTSNDVTRPILTGVNFYTADGSLYLAATDGYRLAERRVCKLDKQLSAIVPATTLNDVIRLLSGDDKVTIKYNDEQISFVIGDITITSRLIDGKFIDYKQLIPSDTKFVISTNRSDFIKITKVAELFSRESAGSVMVEGNDKDQQISVRSITSELGDNKSSIEADIKGGDPTVSLNSKFLIDALNCIEGDKVEVKFSGKLSPVLLTGANKDYKHIIMPVKS